MENESELRNVFDVENKMGEIALPFNEIVPDTIGKWLDVLARSHGTTRELLLISALASTSSLVDKSTIKVFATYEEKSNLFFIAVAPSGSGKTPACHLGCIDPIVEHLEPKLEKSIVVDEASANGLFNHFAVGDTVPILCVDEAHSFLSKIISNSKAQHANLTMERLCKCFDGDCWYALKGNKGKRTGVKCARLSLLAFTTPREFFGKVWPKILAAENGLAERVLLFHQNMAVRDLEVMARSCDELEEYAIKSLNNILEQVYADHTNDGPVQYTLAEAARDAFFKFSKPHDDVPPSQASVSNSDEQSHCKHSKRNKHALRLALSMHVLYDRLRKALARQTGPTSRVINQATLNMAITMVENLEIFMGISETTCKFTPTNKVVKVGVTDEQVKDKILRMKGPFTTARRVSTSFSSQCRPGVNIVQASMEGLQVSGLGIFKVVGKLKVFYKTLPNNEDLQPELANFNISLEDYSSIFDMEDDKLTRRNVQTIMDGHPAREAFEEYQERDIQPQAV